MSFHLSLWGQPNRVKFCLSHSDYGIISSIGSIGIQSGRWREGWRRRACHFATKQECCNSAELATWTVGKRSNNHNHRCKHCKLNPRKAFHFCFHFFNRAKRIEWHGNSNQRCGRNASYVLVWVQRWMKTTCPKPVDLLLASYTYSCSNCFNLRTVSTAGPMFRSNSLHCCPVFPYTGRPGYSIQLRSHLRGKGFVVFLCVCGCDKAGTFVGKTRVPLHGTLLRTRIDRPDDVAFLRCFSQEGNACVPFEV